MASNHMVKSYSVDDSSQRLDRPLSSGDINKPDSDAPRVQPDFIRREFRRMWRAAFPPNSSFHQTDATSTVPPTLEPQEPPWLISLNEDLRPRARSSILDAPPQQQQPQQQQPRRPVHDLRYAMGQLSNRLVSTEKRIAQVKRELEYETFMQDFLAQTIVQLGQLHHRSSSHDSDSALNSGSSPEDRGVYFRTSRTSRAKPADAPAPTIQLASAGEPIYSLGQVPAPPTAAPNQVTQPQFPSNSKPPADSSSRPPAIRPRSSKKSLQQQSFAAFTGFTNDNYEPVDSYVDDSRSSVSSALNAQRCSSPSDNLYDAARRERVSGGGGSKLAGATPQTQTSVDESTYEVPIRAADRERERASSRTPDADADRTSAGASGDHEDTTSIATEGSSEDLDAYLLATETADSSTGFATGTSSSADSHAAGAPGAGAGAAGGGGGNGVLSHDSVATCSESASDALPASSGRLQPADSSDAVTVRAGAPPTQRPAYRRRISVLDRVSVEFDTDAGASSLLVSLSPNECLYVVQ